ncbi:MAG: hypothetical protein VB094_04360 [Oscillibacter sp.]|nr:hypothetical protein [Oscillibacter sp.]
MSNRLLLSAQYGKMCAKPTFYHLNTYTMTPLCGYGILAEIL